MVVRVRTARQFPPTRRSLRSQRARAVANCWRRGRRSCTAGMDDEHATERLQQVVDKVGGRECSRRLQPVYRSQGSVRAGSELGRPKARNQTAQISTDEQWEKQAVEIKVEISQTAVDLGILADTADSHVGGGVR